MVSSENGGGGTRTHDLPVKSRKLYQLSYAPLQPENYTSMGKIVVIAGTDSAVGKTFVTSRLAAYCRGRGIDVRAVKLIETGTQENLSDTEDGVVIARAAGQASPLAALRRYHAPAAPAEAADREGRPVDIDVMVSETRAIAREASITFVEGNGGLLSPITWKRTLVDVARVMRAPVIVVAADRLGTLNHTLLTVSALELAGVHCLGVVMNHMPGDPHDTTQGTNVASLKQVSPALRVVATSGDGWEGEVLGR